MVSEVHQTLVKGLIDHFESNGITIMCSSYQGYNDCGNIEGHKPDIRARDLEKQLNYIGEAKTENELRSENVKKEFEEFSARTMNSGKSEGKKVPFYVMVNNESMSELQQKIKDFGLSERDNIHLLNFNSKETC